MAKTSLKFHFNHFYKSATAPTKFILEKVKENLKNYIFVVSETKHGHLYTWMEDWTMSFQILHQQS